MIARVPFDEGSLTGTLTKDSTWPEGDWRGTLLRAGESDPDAWITPTHSSRSCPPARSMPDMALRFILANPDVDVVIPGMRKPTHVRSNISASDREPLSPQLLAELKKHRWDREPSEWSQ